MIVFCKADGTIDDVLPSPVYQGSNLSGSIYFVAPLSRANAVTVAFKLPNGIYTQSYPMTGVSELEGVTDKLGNEYSVWEWQDANAEVTKYAGLCAVQFSVYLPNGQLLTTARTSFEVKAGVTPILPSTPTQDVYDSIVRYLGVLDGRTENVPYLVKSIQKVKGKSNAFTYTNNSGGISSEIVIGGGTDVPVPVNTASKVTIPKYLPDSTTEYAWQPIYESDGVTISGYKYTVEAAMHGQMRDGAVANDLWVSFDEAEDAAFKGAYEDYTVSATGDITITVTTPIDLTVRVWNGKGLVDDVARADIATETARAESAENTIRTDLTAMINAETDRAENAESEIRADLITIINAEATRAESAETNLQTQITELQNTGVDIQAREDIEKLSEDFVLQEDIMLAGNYTQVGNISKESDTATATYPAKGKTVTQVLTEIFSKRLQPTITQMPSVSGFALIGAMSAVEAGTSVPSYSFGTAVLNAGSYTYAPATGITAQSYMVDRICTPASMSATGVATAASGTDNNGGNGFVIGDSGGTNTVSAISYKVTVNYNEGAIANDNLGDPSDPIVRIAAGSATQSTITVRPYRNFFYGTVSMANPPTGTGITSAVVRGLSKSNRAYSSGTITLNVPSGATGVYIACVSTATGVTKVINETALNADVTATFTKQQNISVEGANGYTALSYNVWYYVPAVPYENAATLKVTLG